MGLHSVVSLPNRPRPPGGSAVWWDATQPTLSGEESLRRVSAVARRTDAADLQSEGPS
jgi:hypothetical protein